MSRLDRDEFHVPAIVYWIGAPYLLLTMALERRRGVLRPLERKIVDSVVMSASVEVAERLKAQLDEINHANRTTAGSTETMLYRIDGIRPRFSSVAPLSVPSGEHRFATVRWKLPESKERRATLWALDGRLVSIEFSADVESSLGRVDAIVTQVRIV